MNISLLELKVPPPLVAAITALMMWGIFWVTPVLQVSNSLSLSVAIIVGLMGISISIAGASLFRQTKTTVNPMKPETASALVDTGIFALTRNPMYLGIMLVLVAWAIFLLAPYTLVGPLIFVCYISRFQIKPEERALEALFGAQYLAYKEKVRRWI